MNKTNFLFIALVLNVTFTVVAQNTPLETVLSDNGRMLLTGKKAPIGLYDSAMIRTIYLQFDQPDFWKILENNFEGQIELPATLTVDQVVYDGVGVRFKGNTSYTWIDSPKKSFNISMDYSKPGQTLMGYKTLNLHNGFEDPSFLREVFYQHQIRKHTPAAKSNFIQLYINGQYWGIYPNIEQINKTFTQEWYPNNLGSLWRPDFPGFKNKWWMAKMGAALNYLGKDSMVYKKYYSLRSSKQQNPWQNLIKVTDILQNTPPDQLPILLPPHLDIDKTLWFLASEIVFSDDDSYVNKGTFDYFFYYDAFTERISPIEYDGNGAMSAKFFPPFMNADNPDYPLLYRLLNIPEWRQRYLAHLRTILAEEMQPETCLKMLDNYQQMIAPLVAEDPKKIYTTAQFTAEMDSLISYCSLRYDDLMSNPEVARKGPSIQQVAILNQQDLPWGKIVVNEQQVVRATISCPDGISKVQVYSATDWSGRHEITLLYDDGVHQDGKAGDGVFGNYLPVQSKNTRVQFYVEAIAADVAKSVSYSPAGAEHDVFTYLVLSD